MFEQAGWSLVLRALGAWAALSPVAWADTPAIPTDRALHDEIPLAMKSLAATCAACHGTNGHAVADTAIPGLAGRPADELAAMLRAFKNGTRPGTVMPQLAKGYDDGQITALAQYFAAQRSSRREARGASGASRPSEQRAHQDHSGDRRGRGEQP